MHSSMGIMAPRPTWRVISLLNQINRGFIYFDAREVGELQANIETLEISLNRHGDTIPGGER